MKPFLLFVALLIFISVRAQTGRSGRTTGPLPYLEWGPGDDRLGGAKMTYLDTNIFLHVIDSTGDDYKVQLSQQHVAFAPKANVKWDTAVRKPYYLTSSWRVYGDDQYDYVTLALPERLPYKSTQLLSPSKLVVDIYGATNNTNWITQLKTAKEVKNVWAHPAEDDVFQVHIELAHPQHWGHAIYYNKNTLVIRIKRQPSLRLKGLRVAVDAGHGGTNTGALGIATRVAEKDYTLKIAAKLRKYLERKGAIVFMTRTNDTDLTMIDRTLLLRKEDPHLLLSIHLNSSSNASIKGTSTYYRYTGFRSLSVAVLDELLRLELANFGNIGAFNFALSGPTEYPNCLVEVAFLSNREDEQRIANEDFQQNVSKRITRGLRNWLRSL